MPILKLKLGFTSGSDFLPSSSQNRPHHGYPPVLLLLSISKRPQLFPVVKLCLSKLQKPSFPAQPRSWSYFYPVTCVLSPPPLPSPPAPAAHTRRDCRADRAISSPRRERSSAPAAASPRTASPFPAETPQPLPTSSSAPPARPRLRPAGQPLPPGPTCPPANAPPPTVTEHLVLVRGCPGGGGGPHQAGAPTPQESSLAALYPWTPCRDGQGCSRGGVFSLVVALNGGGAVGFRNNTPLLLI